MPDSAMSVRPQAARDARCGALGGAVETVTETITVAAGVFGSASVGTDIIPGLCATRNYLRRRVATAPTMRPAVGLTLSEMARSGAHRTHERPTRPPRGRRTVPVLVDSRLADGFESHAVHHPLTR